METIGGGGGRTTDAEDITSGTFVKKRIPELPTSKITEGTFNANRIPTLPDLKGTLTDAKIPDLDTLSYSAAFADAQIPNLPTTKITSGTFTLPRIPGTLTGKDADSVDGADAGIAANDVFKIPAGIAQGDMFHVDSGGSVVKLSAGTSGHFLKTQGAGTNPQWAAVPGGGDMLKSVYDTGDNSIVDNSERLEGNTLGSVRDHNVAAAKITSGTIDDARIPNLETLSYGAAFGTAQIPDLPTVKITSGTFDSDRIPILPTDRYGSAVLVSGTRVMEGDFTLGSHALKFNNMKLFEEDADWLHLTDIAGSSFKKFKAHTLDTSYGQIFYGTALMFDFYPTAIYALKELHMYGNKITNLLDPTSDQNAATKYYVDRHPKTLWVPVTYGTTMDNYGAYPLARCAALVDTAYISFKAPDDLHTITEAKVVVIPRVTQAAADWDIYSYYAAAGEAYNTHTESDTASTYNVTDEQMFEVDISGILTSLAAGDYVGILFSLHNAAHDVDVLGVMFKYT